VPAVARNKKNGEEGRAFKGTRQKETFKKLQGQDGTLQGRVMGNASIAPENGWLEDDPFLLGPSFLAGVHFGGGASYITFWT